MQHLPENAPGHVLPMPSSPGFAPLMLRASHKDRKVWGLAGFHASASSEPPPCMAVSPMGGSVEGPPCPQSLHPARDGD